MPAVLRGGAEAPTSTFDRASKLQPTYTFQSAHFQAGKENNTSRAGASSPAEVESGTNNVAVILGYYEGERFISEQLRSIFSQTHPLLHVFIYDDQSKKPANIDSLALNAADFDRISVEFRPQNIGVTKNFLRALENIPERFEYFAFSDQDDVWHADKLEKAITALSECTEDTPALYCARTETSDATCKNTLGLSPLFSKPPSFANALIQNIGGGNTMVFNKAARNLIVASSVHTEVIAHDWWCYQIVTGAGGIVIYDTEPCLKYRQHLNNLVGVNASWRARYTRFRALLQGRFRKWNDVNLEALLEHRSLLTETNRQALIDFNEARQSRFFQRLYHFKRSGIYRQTLLGNLGLLLGVLLNKV